jgi:CheY-like chemotaxis protein
LLVALTGYGQEEDRRKSKAAGFNAHLVKPPPMESLRQILDGPDYVHAKPM